MHKNASLSALCHLLSGSVKARRSTYVLYEYTWLRVHLICAFFITIHLILCVVVTGQGVAVAHFVKFNPKWHCRNLGYVVCYRPTYCECSFKWVYTQSSQCEKTGQLAISISAAVNRIINSMNETLCSLLDLILNICSKKFKWHPTYRVKLDIYLKFGRSLLQTHLADEPQSFSFGLLCF